MNANASRLPPRWRARPGKRAVAASSDAVNSHGERRAADAENRRRRFDVDRVGRELCDASRHVGHDAADDLQRERKLTFGRRVAEAVEMHFTRRSERDARVVLERHADAAVGPGPKNVGLIDNLTCLRGRLRAGANEVHSPGYDLDSAGGCGLLRESRSGREQREREDADDESKVMGHMLTYRLGQLPPSSRTGIRWNSHRSAHGRTGDRSTAFSARPASVARGSSI